MTLIEIMIVIVLLAIVASGISYAFGALTRTHLRSACLHITAASRWAYNRAISHNSTVRLVFNLDEDLMSFEESEIPVTLARSDDERRRWTQDERDDNVDTAAVDPWSAARARLATTMHPTLGASPFTLIEGSRYQPRALAAGVLIERLITPHEAEPRDEGTGHVYYFNQGQTENAVVWLSDGNDHVFSVEIHPLTGRTIVRDSAYEPEELVLYGDDHTGEVDE